MPCDSTTLTTAAAANNYYGLEDRSVLLAMAGALTALTGIAASQATAGAASNGYFGLQDRELDEAILALCT